MLKQVMINDDDDDGYDDDDAVVMMTLMFVVTTILLVLVLLRRILKSPCSRRTSPSPPLWPRLSVRWSVTRRRLGRLAHPKRPR